MPKNHLGEEYRVEQIMVDGIPCRFCRRTIRVREKAARFDRKERGRFISEYECAECFKAGKDVKPAKEVQSGQ